MTTENITPAAPDEMDFDTAFAEAAAEAEGKTAAPPADPPADPPAGDPPADPPADDPPKDPPADPPADDPPKDPPPAPPAPPAPPPAPPAPPAPPKETPEQVAAREALEASIKPYEPSEAEKSALAKFKVDFPNEYEAVEARLKSVDRDINARVYAAVQDVMKRYDPRIAQVETTTSQSEIERHITALHTAHPDFDAVVVKLPEWINSQPAYLQPALQQVYDQGSTQDVIAMVADYKKATGAPPPAAPPPPPPPKSRPTGVDDLAPVSSRRVVTSPKGTPDPSDFNAAWKEAVAELG